MHILRAKNYRRMPWKNGRGETTEIAVFPEGAGLDDFGWRVSMATVEEGGPFSMFPGVDRTLSILQGEGMVLDIEGAAEPVTLTEASPPFSFAADKATRATLIGGPIADLNIMTVRRKHGHAVARHRVTGGTEIALAGSPALLFCRSAGLRIAHRQRSDTLGRFDAALVDGGRTVRVEGDGVFFLVEFHGI